MSSDKRPDQLDDDPRVAELLGDLAALGHQPAPAPSADLARLLSGAPPEPEEKPTDDLAARRRRRLAGGAGALALIAAAGTTWSAAATGGHLHFPQTESQHTKVLKPKASAPSKPEPRDGTSVRDSPGRAAVPPVAPLVSGLVHFSALPPQLASGSPEVREATRAVAKSAPNAGPRPVEVKPTRPVQPSRPRVSKGPSPATTSTNAGSSGVRPVTGSASPGSGGSCTTCLNPGGTKPGGTKPRTNPGADATGGTTTGTRPDKSPRWPGKWSGKWSGNWTGNSTPRSHGGAGPVITRPRDGTSETDGPRTRPEKSRAIHALEEPTSAPHLTPDR